MLCCASETQKQGLDRIAEVYNCSTSFSKEISTENGKVYTVKVSRSSMLDTLQNDLAACNIALIAYNGFSEEEKNDYDNIRVEMKKPNNKKYVTNLDLKILSDANNQLKIFNDFSKNILSKAYRKIAKNVVPEYQSPDLHQTLGNFINIQRNTHGNVKAYNRTGFGTYMIKDSEDLYYYTGYFEYEDGFKKNYFLTTSKNIETDYIQGFNLDM